MNLLHIFGIILVVTFGLLMLALVIWVFHAVINGIKDDNIFIEWKKKNNKK